MASVLTHVAQLVRGGSLLDFPLLQTTVDAQHRHGRLIGHNPLTKQPNWTPTPFDFTQETKEMKRIAHTKSCFNKVRSDSIPLDRPIPDVRPKVCLNEWYYDAPLGPQQTPSLISRTLIRLGRRKANDRISLPNTSVIFVFYNEPLSTLLRSIHSILDRTPPELLHEIILVNDGSDAEAPWFREGAEFERHIQLLPKTRIANLAGRNGLMRARNIGAALSTGQTVTFLDSHIEVNEGWLQPLMGRIAEGWTHNTEHVVVPVIDAIDADDFNYTAGGIDILGHTWGLGQVGIPGGIKPNSANPARSPIMAGGLLSLSRDFFDTLGYYDPEMHLWGGEEMEISFRIWLCGGSIECMPCSRVGHIFRSDKYWQGQVYKVPGEVIARNKLRASYWMQEYGELTRLSSAPLHGAGQGSMEFYDGVRKRLQCKPFRWYLEHVYPQMLESANKLLGKGYLGKGYVRNTKTNTCLDSLHHRYDGAVYGVYPCHYMRGSQSVFFTHSSLILQGESLLDSCLTREGEKLKKRVCKDDMKINQLWEMGDRNIEKQDDGHVSVTLHGEKKCLTVVQVEEEDGKSPFSLRMMECGDGNEDRQRWVWESLGSN